MFSEPLLETPGDQGVLIGGTRLLSLSVDAPPLPLVVDSCRLASAPLESHHLH